MLSDLSDALVAWVRTYSARLPAACKARFYGSHDFRRLNARPALDLTLRAGRLRYNCAPCLLQDGNHQARAMQIGPHQLKNNLIVAPMAGVTDRPFRQLCKRLGAGMAVSEMLSSRPELWSSPKSRRRADHAGEVEPVSVQIAGADPAMMAEAARYNAAHGAQLIDINMGCPAKKVCNVLAGSALLRDEALEIGRAHV